MTYFIARKLNDYGDVDYLYSWNRKWVASFVLGHGGAMPFDDPVKLIAAYNKLNRKLRRFMDGTAIEYWIIKSDDPRLAPFTPANGGQ